MNARRLERIVALRRRVRDRVSAEVAEADQRLAEGRAEVRAAEQAEADFTRTATDTLRAMTSVRTVRLLEAERTSHAAQVARRSQAVAALERDVAQAKEDLRARTRELRTSERVQDRRRQARRAREQKHEQRLVDDIVGARFGETP